MTEREIRKLIDQGLFTETEFEALDHFWNGPSSKECPNTDGEVENERVAK